MIVFIDKIVECQTQCGRCANLRLKQQVSRYAGCIEHPQYLMPVAPLPVIPVAERGEQALRQPIVADAATCLIRRELTTRLAQQAFMIGNKLTNLLLQLAGWHEV